MEKDGKANLSQLLEDINIVIKENKKLNKKVLRSLTNTHAMKYLKWGQFML